MSHSPFPTTIGLARTLKLGPRIVVEIVHARKILRDKFVAPMAGIGNAFLSFVVVVVQLRRMIMSLCAQTSWLVRKLLGRSFTWSVCKKVARFEFRIMQGGSRLATKSNGKSRTITRIQFLRQERKSSSGEIAC